MKITSTHTVIVTPIELAERLGFAGAVTSTHWEDDAAVVFTIEGDVRPTGMKTIEVAGSRITIAEPAQETKALSNRAVLTIEFSYSNSDAGDKGEAYAEELKKEIQVMLARSPEPGITASVSLMFSG